MKLADISIRRPVLATTMVAVLVVLGLAAYPKVGVDLFPDVEFPVVTVTTIYPGADPGTIESKVLDPLEEAVSTVNGIKVMRSTALENVGFVVLQFQLERDADQVLQDVRDKVASVLGSLPSDLEPPIVEKLDLGATPIMALTVAGPRSTRELTRLADAQIKQPLQAISGVGGIDIVGGRDREVHVWIDPEKLWAYALTITDVVHALGAQNVEIPGGRLELGGTERLVKTLGKVHSVAQLEDVIITAAGGAPVRVGDVARVEDGVEERRSTSSVNGVPAVSLVIRKQSGANTVAVAAQVRAMVVGLTQNMPEDVALTVQTDNSTFIERSIDDVQFDLAFGALLAVIIIMFFLHDWRATLISALALPTSVIATFGFILAMGFTFNVVTMLALSLSIGILIDDARHDRPLLLPVWAHRRVCRLRLALRRLYADPDALVAPAGGTPRGPHVHRLSPHRRRARQADMGLSPCASARPAVPSHQMVLAGALLAWSLSLGSTVPFEFMPAEDRGEFQVSVELPAGTPLEATSAFVERLAAQIRATPGFVSTFVTIGGGAQGEVQKANIQVSLVSREARAFGQTEAMEHVRVLAAEAGDAIVAVEPLQMIGGDSGLRASIIQYNIRGSEYGELNAAADRLIAALEGAGGYVDLDKSYRGGKPELQLSIDREMAADLGIPVALIAMTVRTMFEGQKATELSLSGESFDVNVRLDERFRQTDDALKSFHMGLVTKNAILLVDYALHLQHDGVSVRESLQRAGSVRLRPILMTTGAMIFGMLPVALALSEGGEQRAPMAVAVIGGLITSTVLTPVVVPVVFSLFDSVGRAIGRVLHMEAHTPELRAAHEQGAHQPH